MTPDFAISWDFLRRLHPERSVVVTVIALDKKALPTETFGPNDEAAFLKWIAAAAAMPGNCYYSLAEPKERYTKKMERTDCLAVHYLHVDVDPEDGADPAAERDRILKLLSESTQDVPPPTAIIFSGGGYQALWKLAEPIVINGSLEAAEDAKLYNLQLERVFGADNCHDISRILRLPGTVNLPDAKKVAKGRKPALAELVEWHDDRVYPLSAFLKAPMVQSAAGSINAPAIKAPANIRRIAHVDDLGAGVGNKCKQCIANGFIPEDPAGKAPGSEDHFPSRSERLLWVCCELVRAGVEDDMIFSVLTDPELPISESVLEKRHGSTRYALRQIERAKEEAIDPLLREMNDKHAVIENFGGRCVVIEEVTDEQLGRVKLTRQDFSNFRNRYMNRQIIVGQKTDKKGVTSDVPMPAGEWWLRHLQRRQYSRIVFSPGRDVAGTYNLWRGFSCEAKAGDCSLFLDHVRDVACAGNQEHYDYFVAWMANCVQRPGEQGNSAIVIRGKQGCGKSIIPTLFGQLFGRHYIAIASSKQIVGQFNAHLRDCVLLFADEAFFAGDRSNASTLKHLITSPVIQVEAKGVDAETSPNCIHLMMASNERWVVPADADDRRYFVLECSPDRVGDRGYFDALVNQFEQEGGREALLHYLLTYKSDTDVRNVPKSAALQEQKILSMDVETEWWYSVLRRGTVLIADDEWRRQVPIDLLLYEYQEYTKQFNATRRGNASRMGRSMRDMIPDLQRQQRTSPIQIKMSNGETKTVARPYFYNVPSLEACRKHFDDNCGGPFNWSTDLPLEELPEYDEQPF